MHISFPQTLPRPSSFNHFINNALWVGFYKTDNISEDIKVTNLIIACMFIVVQDSPTAVCKKSPRSPLILSSFTDLIFLFPAPPVGLRSHGEYM